MGRKKGLFASNNSSRRSRSEQTTEEHEAEDPIALATAAKKRRTLDTILAAAKSTATAAPAAITTWLPEHGDLRDAGKARRNHPEDEEEGIGNIQQSVVKSAEEHLDDGANALASLLGYSHEEQAVGGQRSFLTASTSDEEGNMPEKERVGGRPASEFDTQGTSMRSALLDVDADAGLINIRQDAESEGEDIDEQYASFMGELQSSGLLKDDAEGDDEAPPLLKDDAEGDDEAPPPSTAAAKPATHFKPETPASEDGAVEPQEVPATEAGTTGQSDSGAAEQRVLGVLEGMPEWSEVMDMASGQVYFWNSSTNEVAWDPPEGSVPRSKQMTDAIFEADKAEQPAQNSVHATDKYNGPDTGVATSMPGASASDFGIIDKAQDLAEWGTQLSGRLDAALSSSRTAPAHPLQRLALEAEMRAKDWENLAQMGALPWAPYERFYRLCLEKIEAEAEPAIQAAGRAMESGLANPLAAGPAEDGATLPAEAPHASTLEAEQVAVPEDGGKSPPDREEGELPDSSGDMDLDPPQANGHAAEVPPSLPQEPGERAARYGLADGGLPPPLPSDKDDAAPGMLTPPLPDEQPASNAASAAAELLHASLGGANQSGMPQAPVIRRQYIAEPVLSELDRSEIEQAISSEPIHESEAPPLPPEEPEKKRKREKGVAQPVKKRKASAKFAKSTSSLINKWTAVRKDLESDEDEEEPDAEALERKRLKEAEEWRIKQLHAGTTAEENPNFQPVTGDWRAKVAKAAKRQAKQAAAAATEPAPVDEPPQDGRPDLAGLSAGLPSGWKAMWDRSSQSVYYGNPSTKETSWERPS